VQGAACLNLLSDPFYLLGMCALLSLLEAVNTLHVFAQKQNVFVTDFVAALKVTEGQLFSMYVDKGTNFSSDEFWAFRGLLDCTHESIHWRWIEDLNDSQGGQLVFIMADQKIWAQHDRLPVTRCVFQDLVDHVNAEYTGEFFFSFSFFNFF
jgi:hypothetical protein